MKIKFAKEANGTTKFYPITIAAGVVDNVRNQRLNVTLADIYSKLDSLTYKDVYIGKGINYSSVMVAGNHHDIVLRGEHVNMTCNNSKVWIILRNSNSAPLLMMSGTEIPLTTESDITSEGVTYKVYSSTNTYTGTFNVLVF